MLKKNAQLFEALFIASDLLVVSFAWMFSYWVRFASGLIPIYKGVPPLTHYMRLLIFVWLIWTFVFKRMGLYRAMRVGTRWNEMWLLVRANFASVILLIAFTYLFREKNIPFSRLVFLIFGVCTMVFTLISRATVREILRSLRRRGYNIRRAVIVGMGSLAETVAERIAAHREYGVKLVGALASDDAPINQLAYGWAVDGQRAFQLAHSAETQSQLKAIGTYAELPRILEEQQIDHVIVALPLADHQKLQSVISSMGDSIVDVKIIPDFHQFIQLGSQVEEFDGLPVVSLASTPLSGLNKVFKRIFDLVLGLFFLLLCLPVMLIVALLVKLTSRGPVFFKQERVGLDGHPFQIYKFRTMQVDAESNGAQFAVKGDCRVTPLGRMLRRFSIDEIPQLLNVVRGQMSLVGPRPERPVFIQEFRQRVPKYMLRHKVQAGMTGWAQVNGWRGNTSIEKRIEHDLYYIENWSLALDLKIIALTFVQVLRDRNAY